MKQGRNIFWRIIWKKLPRESATLEVFKKLVDVALGDMVQWWTWWCYISCSVWWPWRSFPTGNILWFKIFSGIKQVMTYWKFWQNQNCCSINRDKIITTVQIFGPLSNIMHNCNTFGIPKNEILSKSKNIQTLSNPFNVLGYFPNNIISQVIYNRRIYTDCSHYCI